MTAVEAKEKALSNFTWALMGIMLFMLANAAVVSVIDLKQDYPFHISIASSITLSKLIHPIAFLKQNCYPVWHVVVRLTMIVFGCNGRVAAACVTSGCIVSVWFFAALYLTRRHSDVNKDFLLVVSVLLILVMPIYLACFNQRLLVGQWGPNLWHNPTHLMVRAIAFPCFLLYATDMEKIGRVADFHLGLRRLVMLSLVFLAATLSKPSFIQIFLPAMFCLFVYKVIRYKVAVIKPLALFSLTFLPALLLCGMQFWTTFYGVQTAASGIEFAFLKAWSYHSPFPPLSWLLTLLFPVVMAIWTVRIRQFMAYDALAWLMLGVGLIEGSMLAENGPRLAHCNLVWGYILACFFVWFVSMDKFITLSKMRATGREKWWFRVAVSCLLLHCLSGLWYLWRLVVLRIWV